MKRKALLIATMGLMLATVPLASAAGYLPLYPGFTALRESRAYQKFAVRPLSDFSKILYLIDRFSEADIQIIYDEQPYNAPFATTVARWFLARNYRKQTPRAWVMQWCNASIVSNHLIYVKLPNGEYRLAREILLNEIDALEQVIKENQINNNNQIGSATDKAVDGPLAKPGVPLAQALPSPKSKIS